jgi:hypothetical protein
MFIYWRCNSIADEVNHPLTPYIGSYAIKTDEISMRLHSKPTKMFFLPLKNTGY